MPRLFQAAFQALKLVVDARTIGKVHSSSSSSIILAASSHVGMQVIFSAPLSLEQVAGEWMSPALLQVRRSGGRDYVMAIAVDARYAALVTLPALLLQWMAREMACNRQRCRPLHKLTSALSNAGCSGTAAPTSATPGATGCRCCAVCIVGIARDGV